MGERFAWVARLARAAVQTPLALVVVFALHTTSSLATRPATPSRASRQATPEKISPLAKGDRVPVLEFHDFVAARRPTTMWLDCSVAEFRQILKTIDADKLRPITLDQLYAHLTQGAKLPRGAIVLTFDDNYQGFYDYAYPLLKARRFPFAMFVHTDYVGSRAGQPKMSWDTLKLLVREGLATIGSHTLSHRNLPTLSDAAQKKEITQSKQVLERHLGIRVDYFAYPHGRNNAMSQLLLRQAGYKMAFTGINRPAEESPNIWTVNRYAQTVYRRALHDCGYGRSVRASEAKDRGQHVSKSLSVAA